MKLVCSLFLSCLAFPSTWTRISSSNFDLYTTSTEQEARQTLETFEQARDFFLRVNPAMPASHLPVTIVAFDSMREYKPYAFRDLALAYYVSDEQRDYIVMGDLGVERKRVAIHEYVHLLVRHSGLKIPLWLNEGLAEVYSTMEIQDGRIHLGAMSKDRIYSLTNDSWLRLPALVRAAMDSPEYNDNARVGVFYAQSWLLTHMLMLGDAYSARFPAFLDRVSASGSAAAFADIYGLSLAQVEKEMNAYFRQSTIGGAGYRSELRKGVSGPARAATETEIGIILAKVLALTGRAAQAAKRLEQLAAAHQGGYEIPEALAYVAWQKDDRAGALRHFQTALAQGAAGWKTQYDYARLLYAMGGDRSERLTALRRALEAKPDLDEARLILGRDLYSIGRYGEALSELKRIRIIDPEHRARVYLTMAQAAMEMKLENEAREYAEQARKHARRPDEVTSAEWILKSSGRKPDAQPVSETDEERPILRRRR